jgi:hypothetical protein
MVVAEDNFSWSFGVFKGFSVTGEVRKGEDEFEG